MATARRPLRLSCAAQPRRLSSLFQLQRRIRGRVRCDHLPCYRHGAFDGAAGIQRVDGALRPELCRSPCSALIDERGQGQGTSRRIAADRPLFPGSRRPASRLRRAYGAAMARGARQELFRGPRCRALRNGCSPGRRQKSLIAGRRRASWILCAECSCALVQGAFRLQHHAMPIQSIDRCLKKRGELRTALPGACQTRGRGVPAHQRTHRPPEQDCSRRPSPQGIPAATSPARDPVPPQSPPSNPPPNSVGDHGMGRVFTQPRPISEVS